MNILFLYSELGPYNVVVFEKMAVEHGACLHVVHWDKNKLKPFTVASTDRIKYYKRSSVSEQEISSLAESLAPEITYVCGWMDKGYFMAARTIRRRGSPVVVGFDDQWIGSARQYFGCLLFRLYFSRLFSHAWVAGRPQYEFARRMGFNSDCIISDLLSGNIELFNQVVPLNLSNLRHRKKFLYVGNFRSVKGTDILADGYRLYRDLYKGEWGLICVGNGELRCVLDQHKDIEVFPFTNQEGLIDLCERAASFVLPSRHDQWGVVVHEFGAAGLPLVLSSGVGSRSEFLVEGYNGYQFQNASPDSLARALLRISATGDGRLVDFGRNSRTLAARLTPSISAARFLSLARSNRAKPC